MAVKRQSNVRNGTGTLFGRAAIYARISLDKVGEAAGVGRHIDACRPEYERLLNLVRRLDQRTIDPSLDGSAFEGVTADRWDGLDLDQQRALAGLFVEHVVILNGTRGRYFDPSRVQPVPVENGVS